ncbi:MAG: GNAT family N-acetyltransferase [Defluviitaleaceae bacterium]|nr:GNAT family N-acetyltransferase [Defluviitaleaceae bacterium]
MTTLTTDRLILRDYIESDLDDLHSLMSDKQTMYFLSDISTNTLEESADNLRAAISNSDGRYFCIRDKACDAYIGGVGYTITDRTPLGKIAHMGCFLLPQKHGRGFAAEAARRALEFAFREDGCVRLTTGCYSDNIPSRKVLEKVGFRLEGTRIKAAYHDGKMKDRLEYALNSDEI